MILFATLFLGFGKFFMILLAFILKRGFSHHLVYDIQRSKETFLKEIKASWVIPLDGIVFYMLIQLDWIRFTPSTVSLTLLTFVVIFVFFEIWFYWTHRLLHTKLFWPLHIAHHRSSVISPFSGLQFSFGEKCILTAGSLGFAAVISWWLPITLPGLLLFFGFYYFQSINGHSNVEGTPSIFVKGVLRYLVGTPSFHAMHHARVTGHFGLMSPIQDYLFRTSYDDYKNVYMRAREGQGLTRVNEKGLSAKLNSKEDKIRIGYLAVADTRGHLMRSHLVKELLAAEGIQVDLITTSKEGQAFLRSMGDESLLLSEYLLIKFDENQNVLHFRTIVSVFKYILLPWLGLRDFIRLKRFSKDKVFIVNDSLQPTLLVLAPMWNRLFGGLKVVQVYGENLWNAAFSFLDKYPGKLIRPIFRFIILRYMRLSFGQIKHSFTPSTDSPDLSDETESRKFSFPPIIGAMTTSEAEVRNQLEVDANKKLLVCYLNPQFQNVSIAEAIESAVKALGMELYGVCENYSSRKGWVATDRNFGDKVAIASLFVSSPGMGALSQAYFHQIPFLALLTDQPEQQLNIDSFASYLSAGLIAVNITDDTKAFSDELHSGLKTLASNEQDQVSDINDKINELRSGWAAAFRHLVDQAGGVNSK